MWKDCMMETDNYQNKVLLKKSKMIIMIVKMPAC